MKTYKSNILLLAALSFLFTMVMSCSDEDFLNAPPQDAYSLDEFYNTDEQVVASTNHLYGGRIWFNYYNTAIWSISELGGGNAFTYNADDVPFRNFEVTGINPSVANAWKSNWAVIAQSNMLIKYLPLKATANITPSVLNTAIAEARMMRAVAYFNLVRLWGPVPIITDNEETALNPNINTNYTEDVYKFIEMDLQFATENLPSKIRSTNYAANGHASKGTAKSLLAKVYLYEKKYSEAKTLALDVINSGEFKLLGGSALPNKKYSDLFLTANNNNEESVLAVQWKVTGTYGAANNCNTIFAYSSEINAAQWGGSIAPSMDLMNTAFVTGDLRRKETYMMPGDYYANILSSTGGFTVPSSINAQNTGSGIKKYVVGKASDNVGGADEWGMMENNTYIMRYADVLLIYVEASMAGANSTSDATALDAFNQVRNRSGLPSVSTITKASLFSERRAEFAFEAEYWFDLGRLPRAEAISILSSQNRGDRNYPLYYTPTESDFYMPYPDSEIAKNPKLLEAPVSYPF